MMTKLQSFTKPLDRIAQEGLLIGDLDDMEEDGRVVSLNSKQDYQQANTVTLRYNRGARKQ